MRVFAYILVGVTIVGIVACEGHTRNVDVQRILGGNQNPSEVFAKAQERSQSENCLRMDDYFEILKQDDELYVYQSDAALGNVGAESSEFQPDTDSGQDENVFLRDGLREQLNIRRPQRVSHFKGSALSSSRVGDMFRVIDGLNDACTEVKDSTGNVKYKVDGNHQKDLLVLTNTETKERLEYRFDSSRFVFSLKIIRPTGGSEVCEATLPGFYEVDYALSLSAPTSMTLKSRYAQLIANALDDNEEFKELVSTSADSGSDVQVPSDQYDDVVYSLSQDKFDHPKCE